jgi:manganese/zinc/iron transport system ATP- binding protein
VVAVHHDLNQVRASFDWTLLLNVRVIGCGPPAAVLAPEQVAAAYGGPDEAWTPWPR